MNKIILTGHGTQATAIKKSVEMIMGPVNFVSVVDFFEEDSLETLKNRIENELIAGNNYVICDIKGGTPFNCAYLLQKKFNIKIICGLNMAMVLESCINVHDDNLELLAKKAGIKSIELV